MKVEINVREKRKEKKTPAAFPSRATGAAGKETLITLTWANGGH